MKILTDRQTDWLTDSMEQSPFWETYSHSASQKTHQVLWNPKVYYHVHKSLPLVPILSQILPVHTSPIYFSMIHSNIFLSLSRSSKWSLPFGSSNKNFTCIFHLSHACHMPCISHPPWFDHSNIFWSLQVMKLLIMLSSPQHPVLTHTQCIFFAYWGTPSFTPIEHNR
jgi:hypothetical protein